MKNLKQLSDFFEVFAGATITATSGDKDLKFI